MCLIPQSCPIIWYVLIPTFQWRLKHFPFISQETIFSLLCMPLPPASWLVLSHLQHDISLFGWQYFSSYLWCLKYVAFIVSIFTVFVPQLCTWESMHSWWFKSTKIAVRSLMWEERVGLELMIETKGREDIQGHLPSLVARGSSCKTRITAGCWSRFC